MTIFIQLIFWFEYFIVPLSKRWLKTRWAHFQDVWSMQHLNYHARRDENYADQSTLNGIQHQLLYQLTWSVLTEYKGLSSQDYSNVESNR